MVIDASWAWIQRGDSTPSAVKIADAQPARDGRMRLAGLDSPTVGTLDDVTRLRPLQCPSAPIALREIAAAQPAAAALVLAMSCPIT